MPLENILFVSCTVEFEEGKIAGYKTTVAIPRRAKSDCCTRLVHELTIKTGIYKEGLAGLCEASTYWERVDPDDPMGGEPKLTMPETTGAGRSSKTYEGIRPPDLSLFD